MGNKTWYIITLTDVSNVKNINGEMVPHKEVVAKIKSKGNAYIILQQLKKTYQNVPNIFLNIE